MGRGAHCVWNSDSAANASSYFCSSNSYLDGCPAACLAALEPGSRAPRLPCCGAAWLPGCPVAWPLVGMLGCLTHGLLGSAEWLAS